MFAPVLDVARLAVDAILGVDHKLADRAVRLVGIDHFVDGGWAIEPRRLAIFRKFRPIGIDGSFRSR